MRFSRSAGILAHITSLPSDFGIGDMGPAAFDFVKFLSDAGQTIWQVLPLNPPIHGNSPYSCYSVFAGNPLLISPQAMVQDGWLEVAWLERLSADQGLAPTSESLTAESLTAESPTSDSQSKADFQAATLLRHSVFQRAFDEAESSLTSREEFASFCSNNAWWLDEFARFDALMKHFGSSDWTTWPAPLALRHDDALAEWDHRLAAGIQFSKFVQFIFDQQWNRLKTFANQHRVRIYGDLSIFVARESSDVWANQRLFHLDPNGNPSLVAGVPPDYFSKTGQRWGNPLYRWEVMEADDFSWWTGRFRRARDQFDLLRVDHFRGFESYWEIPAEAPTAQGGQWRQGPGTKPFDAARAALGELPIIAEDLGMITQEVHDLRDRLGFPPMRVLQFGFESEHDDFHRPDRYPEHSVAYTGTHDNDTTMGWLAAKNRQSHGKGLINQWLVGEQEVHFQLIQFVLDSPADTAIIPLQDVLGLGSEARMNRPGTADGNWLWRVRKRDLSNALATRIREMTQKTAR